MNTASKKYNLILLGFFLVIFLFFLHPINGDGDFFHNASVGRDILKTHVIPTIDTYTFTAHGLPWIAKDWATAIIYYLLYYLFGPAAISFYVALHGLAFCLLLYFLLKEYGVNRFARLLTVGLGASVISLRFLSRTEIITFPAILILLLVNKLKEKNPNLVYLYPLIIFLWAILYGAGVFVGLGLLGIFAVYDVFSRKKLDVKILTVTLLAFFVSLLNGNGFKTLFYIALIPKIAQTQGEWASMAQAIQTFPLDTLLFYQYRILGFLIYFFIFLLIVFIQRNKLKSYILLGFLSLGIFLPFFSIRNIPLGVALSLPLLGIFIGNINKRVILYITIILTLCIAFLSIWIYPPGIGQDPLYAADIISYMKMHSIYGKVFANQQFSPYLTYELYPKVTIYADTRDELYLNTPVLSDLESVYENSLPLTNILDNYHVDAVVADPTDGINYQPLLYDKKWQLVYADNQYLLFVRSSLAKTKNLKEILGIDPFSPTGTKPNEEKEAIRSYQNILVQFPTSFSIKFYLAETYLSTSNYLEAVDITQTMSVPFTPDAPLYAMRLYHAAIPAELSLGDCIRSKNLLDNYDGERSNKNIFNLSQKIPSQFDEFSMVYSLICERNIQKAQNYLQMFVNDPTNGADEKKKAQQLFQVITKQTSPL